MAKYNVRNITTGEQWTNITSEKVGELLKISPITARQYVNLYGAYREYVIEKVETEKKYPMQTIPVAILKERDRYVPKLHKKIVDMGLKIRVTEG